MTREEEHLAQADRLIADAERRIVLQGALVAGLPASGESRALAEELLATMNQALALMCAHRRLILDEIERQKAQPTAAAPFPSLPAALKCPGEKRAALGAAHNRRS